ncbi:MAG: tetratricopeptide repeat protein [Desulfobacterales bacterium]
MPSVFKLIVALLFLTTIPVKVHALTPDQVFDRVKDTIVVVKTFDSRGSMKTQGSGVIISPGKIATNCHIVKGGASFKVFRGKQIVSAILYAEDQDKDISILYARGIEGKPAQLGKAAYLKVGVPVYAVGAKQSPELSLSKGIVVLLRGVPQPFIQTTVSLSPGSSGGGLFDGEGRLVGLTTLYVEGGQNFSFAIPAEWIAETRQGRKTAAGSRGRIEWLKRAIALEKLKDWQDLLEWCLKWTKSEPLNAEALYNLGIANGNLKRYEDAIEAFRKALYINPKYAEAWNNLGDTYRKLNRYKDAIEFFRKALRSDPKYADPWNNLGVAYGELKRHEDAIEVFRQALRINPKYADAWYNLGVSYSELKQYNEAIEAFREVLLINPEDAEAWYNLGVVYSEVLLHDDAIDAFRKALRINPRYSKAWYNIGSEYALSGKRAAALDAVRELRRLDPERAEGLFNLIGSPDTGEKKGGE